MRAFRIVNDRFHIEDDRHIGTGMALRDILGVELAGAVNHKLLFLQFIALSFHFGEQSSPIHVGELKVIVLFPFKVIAGIADGIIVSQNFADPDTGKNPLKHIGRA